MTTHGNVALTFYNASFTQKITIMKNLCAFGLRKHPLGNVYSFQSEEEADSGAWASQAVVRAAMASGMGYFTFVVQAGNNPAMFKEYPRAIT